MAELIMDSPGEETSIDPLDKQSNAFREFADQLASFSTPEEKISYGLQFMRTALSQEGNPHFREFWDARRFILPFFKDAINPAIRAKFWSEYVELTVEARRLKEILEEQSAFDIEQIDLAIEAIEKDLANFETLLAQMGKEEFSQMPQSMQSKIPLYQQLQQELNLLNTLASRLNALRKEVAKMSMRVRFKAKFFKRLSELGDRIFPKRKQLIDQVSGEFEQDVDQFADRHFSSDRNRGVPYFLLREEIKAFQGTAKMLTLNSGAFSRTRLKLSECWDKIKAAEKEHRKVSFEKKEASFQQRKEVEEKIEALKGKAPEMSLRELDQGVDAIAKEMRTLALEKEDIRALREEFAKLRAPHLSAQEQKTRELEQMEREKLRLKREKIDAVKETASRLIKEGAQLELEVFSLRYEELSREMDQIDASKMEKQQLERLLRPLKDLLAEKKEHSLLNLSDDERKTIEALRLVLKQKKERRQEIKEQVEVYRKALGSSNLDFEKAMLYRELLDQEKERLDKANLGIEEIEQKIAELES